jgi:hypothetical protein
VKVALLPGDTGGCGSYRIIWPGHAAADRLDVRVYAPRGEIKLGMNQRGDVVKVLGLDPIPDVLVMQRVGTQPLVGLVRWAQARGIAVVADFDDAMWCLDKDNTAYPTWNRPRGVRQQHWSWCEEAARLADLVTVTTDGLASRYGAHGRVEVLPNRVPAFALQTAHGGREDRLAYGWSGYTATHPGDCVVSRPAAQWALANGHRLAVMADFAGAAEDWGVSDKLVDYVPSEPLGPLYYSALANLDVMMVGLRTTPFNRCKSTLKVLEAAAAGVPAIASATQPHRKLQASGFPVLLADNAHEWTLRAKIMSDYWEDRAMAARAAVETQTIEGNIDGWIHAWQRAANRREGFNR